LSSPLPKIKESINAETTIFWFRRDLRLNDNAGLYFALKENMNVLPVFIFDSAILDKLEDKNDRRVAFIHKVLVSLKDSLEKMGSSLLVVHAEPINFFNSITPRAVYTNHDYEPYARNRDNKVEGILQQKKVIFKTFKDQVIFEKDEILKSDASPYTIFTPYSKKWKAALKPANYKPYNVEAYTINFMKTMPFQLPSLESMGFKNSVNIFPDKKINTSIIDRYDKQRNYPGVEGTTQLSVHLRFGTISIREVVKIGSKLNETFLNELIWRDFYQMILWHFPSVDKAFKSAYDNIVWRNNAQEFEAWCEGRTGYPIVDAGMRELNTTGFMHNRVRMVVASFLTKHLLIDWRWGEAYFANKLLDFDLASNNGGWKWAAGCGCDAAPYFRVFNPSLQAQKFDPQSVYIKRWVPEVDSDQYSSPIVEHAFARARAIATYKEALKNS